MTDSLSGGPVTHASDRVDVAGGLAPQPPEALGAPGPSRGFLEVLLYSTGTGQLVLDVDGSGVPHISRSFGSAAELGDFMSDLLAGGDVIRHPVLVALREAVRRLSPE